jgi:hypothetical protein
MSSVPTSVLPVAMLKPVCRFQQMLCRRAIFGARLNFAPARWLVCNKADEFILTKCRIS